MLNSMIKDTSYPGIASQTGLTTGLVILATDYLALRSNIIIDMDNVEPWRYCNLNLNT